MQESDRQTIGYQIIVVIVWAIFILGIVHSIRTADKDFEFTSPCNGTFYDC